MKRCCKCGEAKRIVDFARNRTTRDGYQRECRECCRKYQAAKRAALDDAAKSERRIYFKGWKKAHHTMLRASQAAYRQSRREEQRAYLAAYYLSHKTESQAYAKAYQKTDKGREICRIHNSRRRAARHENTPHARLLTREEWATILSVSKGRCYWCGKKRKPTIDHVIPLSKGGRHVAENIVVSCLSCNCKKQAKIVTLF